MPRSSTVSCPATARPVAGRVRAVGCVRVRFRPHAKAHNVCRVESYVRVSPCARSRIERFSVHWFDPWLAKTIVVTGRMH